MAMVAISMACPTSAQMIELHEINGKRISCVTSGLSGFGRPCGTDGGYASVFIGSVLSATDISDTEQRLWLRPEETFLGDPPSEITVTTQQGACLASFKPGDQWLFYLQNDRQEENHLLLPYGSPSAPVTKAQENIALLRKLARMTDSGLIKGSVKRTVPDAGDGQGPTFTPIPDHKVIARREADGVEYSAFTDKQGAYEFEPLPAGTYRLTANTTHGLWAGIMGEGHKEVRERSCATVGFVLHPDSSISGHVRTATGKPARGQDVAIVAMSSESPKLRPVVTDTNGYFEIRGLQSGKYLVGIDIDADQGSPQWEWRVYYPGVKDKKLAVVIELGANEERTDIDLQQPDYNAP